MISVVVPTLTEATLVAETVAAAKKALGRCEVIVVDGGSTDGTRELARAAGATVSEWPGSRAEAMNAGARLAGGDVLLFLHADTTLPAGAGEAVRGAVEAGGIGGAFRLCFDERRPVLELLAEIRSRWLEPVYGDQAIFVVRDVFERLGGYRSLPVMEDYDLVRRLRRVGRFTLVPLAVTTSARRHRRHGTVPTLLRIWSIQVLYRAGVPARLLARAYPISR